MWFQIFLQNDYEYDEVMRVIQNFQVNLLIIIFNKKSSFYFCMRLSENFHPSVPPRD